MYCSANAIVHINKSSQIFTIFRFLRGSSLHVRDPKLLKGKIKTMIPESVNETNNIKTYDDLLKNIRASDCADELELEQAFVANDDFGTAVEKADQLYDIHQREEKAYKSYIKKQIIKKKYFKPDKETNLLTHAAKEQIRYLHKQDPMQWTPEALSESFPISINGVKKLLRSSFTQSSPEKIIEHDKEVAKKWEILNSGKLSPSISFLTQKLWREGKFKKDNFSGNAHLPKSLPVCPQQELKQKERKTTGEYSAIIQKYIDHKEQKALLQSGDQKCTAVDNTESKREVRKFVKKSKHQLNDSSSITKHSYYAPEEIDNAVPTRTSLTRQKDDWNTTDVLHSQFKEHLVEEINSQKYESSTKDQYQKWLEQQSTKKESAPVKKPCNAEDIFSKVPKYQKDSVQLNNAKCDSENYFYLYDDKVGYQHPHGKPIKANIRIPSHLYKKGRTYKVGQCIYDDDGEFLYKLPS